MYEKLLHDSPVPVDDKAQLPGHIKGLYIKTTDAELIMLNKQMKLSTEKTCILAEELGHYYTSTGNIMDQRLVNNRKQELRARQWAYEQLVPLSRIVDAYHAHITGRHELADFLEVTEEFLEEALNRYKDKYGLYAGYEQRYLIFFEPLGVVEIFS